MIFQWVYTWCLEMKWIVYWACRVCLSSCRGGDAPGEDGKSEKCVKSAIWLRAGSAKQAIYRANVVFRC